MVLDLTEASVCYDAVFTPDGDSVSVLANEADYIHFINEAYRHCKALAFATEAETLIQKTLLKDKKLDQAVVLASKDDLTTSFIKAMKGHRVWNHEEARKVGV